MNSNSYFMRIIQIFCLPGQPCRVRDHYHVHRLSFWLNLIPRFMSEQYSRKMDNGQAEDHHGAYDKDDDLGGFLYLRHHLLDNFNDLTSYDGPVRDITLKSITSGTSSARVKSTPTETGWLRTSGSVYSDNLGNESLTLLAMLNRKFASGTSGSKASSISSLHNSTGTVKGAEAGASSGQEQQDPDSPVPSHLTALAVTIMVGFSLLVLNILIFAGVYYQLNRHPDRHQQHHDDANGTVLLYESTNNANHYDHQYHQHATQVQQHL